MGYVGNYSKQWVKYVFHVFSAHLKVWELSGKYRWSYGKLRKLWALFIIFIKSWQILKIVLNIGPRVDCQFSRVCVDAWRISGPYPIDWIFPDILNFDIQSRQVNHIKVHFCTNSKSLCLLVCQNDLNEFMSMLI